jgi:mannose-1-phosphate guanylyltransferase/mannose-6-phosphate isomerase
VVCLDARDCYLHSTNRLLAALGVSNVAVLETADAVLVIDRNRTGEVKDLVDRLVRSGREEARAHTRGFRPWGWYERLAAGERFQVKRIAVNPGAAISLQYHNRRAEHWVVAHGAARVTVGENARLMREDEYVYIPVKTAHRLENPGPSPLEIIETQTGTYLGEDDIVRLEDAYGRI